MSDDFDYKCEVTQMLLAAQLLAGLNLDGIVETIQHADALGPFVDPTAYMNALDRGDMRDIEALAEALREPARVFAERIAPKVPPRRSARASAR